MKKVLLFLPICLCVAFICANILRQSEKKDFYLTNRVLRSNLSNVDIEKKSFLALYKDDIEAAGDLVTHFSINEKNPNLDHLTIDWKDIGAKNAILRFGPMYGDRIFRTATSYKYPSLDLKQDELQLRIEAMQYDNQDASATLYSKYSAVDADGYETKFWKEIDRKNKMIVKMYEDFLNMSPQEVQSLKDKAVRKDYDAANKLNIYNKLKTKPIIRLGFSFRGIARPVLNPAMGPSNNNE